MHVYNTDILTHNAIIMIDRHIQVMQNLRSAAGNRFAYEQPFTPEELVAEITAKINADATQRILVLFTVEWALYLKKVGYTNIVVAAVNDTIIANACKVFNIKYYDLSEIEKNNMKFDVIVGNPPYQDSDKNPLYYKFHNAAVNLLVPNGQLAFITPDAMAVSLETGIVKGCHKVSLAEIKLVNIDPLIKNKHFPTVGINNFCYYIVVNSKKTNNPYKIISAGGEYYGIMSPLKPLVNSLIVNSILEKCFDYDRNFYEGTWNTAGVKAVKDITGSSKVALRIEKDGSLATYPVRWESTEHKMLNRPKVFISAFGNKAIVAYDHTLVCAKEKLIYTVPTNSDAESENLVHLIDCTLQRFLKKIISARGPYIDFLRHFKGIPLTKRWTDTELYAHFGLTQDEIDFIEATVK